MSSVSLGVWIGVGGRYEPAALCGVSHFIEHMLFKGTGHRSAKQISQDVEGIGGYLNAFTRHSQHAGSLPDPSFSQSWPRRFRKQNPRRLNSPSWMKHKT